MKRTWILLMSIVLMGNFCISTHANGTDSYATGYELWRSWEENGNTPEQVTYVWGDESFVSIGIVQGSEGEETKKQICDWVIDDSSLTFVEHHYSRWELEKIKSEISKQGQKYLLINRIDKKENCVMTEVRHDGQGNPVVVQLINDWLERYGGALRIFWSDASTGQRDEILGFQPVPDTPDKPAIPGRPIGPGFPSVPAQSNEENPSGQDESVPSKVDSSESMEQGSEDEENQDAKDEDFGPEAGAEEKKLKVTPLVNPALHSGNMVLFGCVALCVYTVLLLLIRNRQTLAQTTNGAQIRTGKPLSIQKTEKLVANQPPAGPSADLDHRIFESIRRINAEKSENE